MSFYRITCLIFSIALGLPLPAQQAGNRMLLKTGGPTASVRSIRFSPDNQYLYAAGIDKQVHVWKLYDANNKLTPRKTQSYYWTLNRAERGCIYTMDVSRTGSIAFGGYSAYGNSGDILEFDGANRRLTGVLPRKRSNDLTVPRTCLLYTSPSPRDQRGSRMPSSA